jgi:MFS transporter, CP family, cyanate transporter
VSGRARSRILVGVAIVALGVNLRTAVASLAVLLGPIHDSLGFSPAIAGLLTTLPLLCFATVGLGSPFVIERLGPNKTAAVLLLVIAVGLAARAATDSTALFLIASAMALAGAAIGNVLLPPLMELHFADRLALGTAAAGAAIMAGSALSAFVSVPMSAAPGGWRTALAVWSAPALLAGIVWVRVSRRDGEGSHRTVRRVSRLPFRTMARSPLAWAVMAVFAAQSACAYAQVWLAVRLTDAGVGRGMAGAMVGLAGFASLPATLVLPALIRRSGDRPYLIWSLSLVTVAGWLGVLLAPTHLTWLWALLLGLGGGAFSWTLTMIGHRTRTVEGTAALSAFAQGVGYLFAGLGPFGVAVLHGLTGEWRVPMTLVVVLGVLIGVLGTIVCRAGTVEDGLPTSGAHPHHQLAEVPSTEQAG